MLQRVFQSIRHNHTPNSLQKFVSGRTALVYFTLTSLIDIYESYRLRQWIKLEVSLEVSPILLARLSEGEPRES